MTGSGSAFTSESVPLGSWLDRLGARSSTPSGGSAAAVVLAAAAALASMVAAFSGAQLPDATVIGARSSSIRHRALDLAGADEAAVEAMLSGDAGPAASEAARVPLELVKLSAELGALFRRLLDGGNPRLRGDALVGSELVAAAAAGAAALVRIDCDALGAPERGRTLQELAAAEDRLGAARLGAARGGPGSGPDGVPDG